MAIDHPLPLPPGLRKGAVSHGDAVRIGGWSLAMASAVVLSKSFLDSGGDALLLCQCVFALGAIPLLWNDARSFLHGFTSFEVVVTAVLYCCSTILTSFALKREGIATVYLIKALGPCLSAALEDLRGRRRRRAFALLSLVAATMSTSYISMGQKHGDLTGIALAGLSALASTLNTPHLEEGNPIDLVQANIVSLLVSTAIMAGRMAAGTLVLFEGSLLFLLPATLLIAGGAACEAQRHASTFTLTIHEGVMNGLFSFAGLLYAQGAQGAIRGVSLLCLIGVSYFVLASQKGLTTEQSTNQGARHPLQLRIKLAIGILLAAVVIAFNVSPADDSACLGSKRQSDSLLNSCPRWSNNGSTLLSWRLADEGDPQNFGDELSEHLFSRMLGFQVPISHARTAEDTIEPFVLGVGSLGGWSRSCDTWWGTGVYSFNSVPSTTKLDIRALRGPWSRRVLMENNPGLYVPKVFGDPGLLVPTFFPEFVKNRSLEHMSLLSRVTVILHFKHEGLVSPDPRWKVISARAQDWRSVVQTIVDSSFVISSSLHGLVIADAFGVPSRGLHLNNDEPLFKYADFYAGSGRPTFFMASTVEEGMWLGPEPAAVFDAQTLIATFPHDKFERASAKP